MRTGRFLLPVLFTAILTTHAVAQEAAQNALAREEISDGWILLFDGKTAFGWQAHGGAQLEASDGVLHVETGGKGWAGTTSEFADFLLRLDYRIEGDGNCAVYLRAGRRGDPKKTGTPLVIEPATPDDRWHRLEVRAEGAKLIATIDGEPAVDTEVPTDQYAQAPRGVIGLGGGPELSFRNVTLKLLGAESIFNGKDLSGWTVLPGRKSVYSVTPEGWLNVKNGNGDLQTDGQWDDFVLQLDIISNGDHLNSGIFFRGDKGTFWSGYESQIRNEWVTDVELVDGSKLTGSYTDKGDEVTIRTGKETKTLPKERIKRVVHHRERPIDFGTGGIYNRQPARKVVPNDREWFTKTVVAAGNHIAVWVDGYQVSDFTDTRPRGSNARKNQRLEPGPISLQGHDPTTDLSFRNIRVAAFPKRKP